jgi:hypothetical protein
MDGLTSLLVCEFPEDLEEWVDHWMIRRIRGGQCASQMHLYQFLEHG